MNLDWHLRVLWRHRVVVALGLVVGLVLAFLAAFQVSLSGGPTLERRGTELWSSSSRMLVTQLGFPEGRVTLPAAAVPGTAAAEVPGEDKRQQFADPTRFVNLALLYSVISYSDQVRTRLGENVAPDQIEAVPLDVTGGGDILPIINLTTKADSAEAALRLNQDAFLGLKDLLTSEQARAKIPVKERVVLQPLNKAADPILVSGRSPMASLLAIMLTSVAVIALAHVLEAIRLARRRRLDAFDPDFDKSIDWDRISADEDDRVSEDREMQAVARSDG